MPKAAGLAALLLVYGRWQAFRRPASERQLTGNMWFGTFALDDAKTAGKNRWLIFESKMQTVVHDRLGLELDLHDALQRDQFFLLYQPTFDLQSETITGVEALLRWRHPTRGVVAPETFIPLAEETGLIVPIGRWVLRTACGQAAVWRRTGHSLAMAVNLSARQLDYEHLVQDVTESRALIHTLVQLGKTLGLETLGEGIEQEAQLRQLQREQCDSGQGFLFARPLASDAVDELLSATTAA